MPEVNKAIEEARLVEDAAERAEAWAGVDRARQRAGAGRAMDMGALPLIQSTDVAGVVNLQNASWDTQLHVAEVEAANAHLRSWRKRDPSPRRRVPFRLRQMLRYIIRRILWSIALLVICSAVVFAIFYIFPTADPAKLRAGRAASAEQIELIRESLGLDDPKHEQFLRYMAGVFTPYKNEEKGVDGPFDLGTSVFQNNTPVREIIFDRLPATVFLVTGAVVIWLAIAIPVGIISAVRRRSLLDRATMITTSGVHLGPGLLARARRPLPVRQGRGAVPDLPRDRQLQRR